MPLSYTGNTINVYGRSSTSLQTEKVKSSRKAYGGFNFNLDKNEKQGGFLQKTTNIRLIKGAVEQLLLTSKGERVMLPDFGCNLKRYLFQPLDENTFNSIKRDIVTSFSKYIVGAKIQKLTVIPNEDSGVLSNSLKIILNLILDDSELEIFDVEVTIL